MYELDKPCVVYREDCPLYQKVGDGMTNEKAIEELREIKSAYSNKQQFHEACLMRLEHEALDMAIQALESISKYKDAYGKGWNDGAKAAYEHLKMCEEETSGDLISRQAVLDAMSDTWKHICFVARRRKPTKGEEAVYSDMVGTVKSMPPVNPQEPQTDVLDKIRAEIEKAIWEDTIVSLDGTDEVRIPRLEPDDVFEIIDKYRAESEGISKYKDIYNKGWDDGAKATYEHLKMCEEEQGGDLISRDAVRKVISVLYGRELCEITHQINLLPAVKPQEPKADRGLHLSQRFKDWKFIQEPKTGFWCGYDKNDITLWNWWDINTCSICGNGGKHYNKFRYCPSCGAKMESEDKG